MRQPTKEPKLCTEIILCRSSIKFNMFDNLNFRFSPRLILLSILKITYYHLVDKNRSRPIRLLD